MTDMIRQDHWRIYFISSWRLERRIEDRRGNRVGAAFGEATIAAGVEKATAICREALTIDYGGRRFAGEQTILWRFDHADGPTLHFKNGRFFIAMRFGGDGGLLRSAFSHGCGEDLYEGVAEIAHGNAWRLVWNVRGPRKDYTLDTLYSRIGGQRAAATDCESKRRVPNSAPRTLRGLSP
ncbi:MAG: DUF6314 family protein [Parvularculaceae bacterium]